MAHNDKRRPAGTGTAFGKVTQHVDPTETRYAVQYAVVILARKFGLPPDRARLVASLAGFGGAQ